MSLAHIHRHNRFEITCTKIKKDKILPTTNNNALILRMSIFPREEVWVDSIQKKYKIFILFIILYADHSLYRFFQVFFKFLKKIVVVINVIAEIYEIYNFTSTYFCERF